MPVRSRLRQEPSQDATSSESLEVWFGRVRVPLPLPLAGSLLFGVIRIFGLALTWLLLSHGTIARGHWSLPQWMISWDAHFYLILATRGYGFHWPHPLPGGSLYPWFPGYPAAIAAIDWIPGIHPAAAGALVTGMAGLLAAAGLTRLGMLLAGDRRVSLLLVALWSGVPGTFVFSMVYPEALYCAFAVWALAALTRRRWLTAAALTIAAGTTGSQALALTAAFAGAAAGAVITAIRTGDRVAACLRPAAGLAAAPLGLAGYWGLVAVWTHRLDGWFWIESAHWHQSFDWGKGTLQNIGHTFIGRSSLPATLLVVDIVAALILTAWNVIADMPFHLRVYTAVVFLTAFGSSATYLCSKPRFLLPAFLLTLPLAKRFGRLPTPLLAGLAGILAAASTWFGVYLTVVARLPP